MNTGAAEKILQLNYQFYQSFAADFSATRGRLQPGVEMLLSRFAPGSRILDLGCGNGHLARVLGRKGFSGFYLGADFSPNLLKYAVLDQVPGFQASFISLDLASPAWNKMLPEEPFDIALCFAVLHHIPGQPGRAGICRNIRRQLRDSGRLFLSNWQFLKSKRLVKRIIPWNEAGFSESEVDPGDYLLDWKRGGLGIRYAHHFTREELAQLAAESGFRIEESFESDGKGGDLSLYQVWVPA